VSLSPVKTSRPGIVAAESVAGVSAYELTAIQGSTASPSAPLFWGEGYNVVKLPFVPYSGVFLNVTATSQSAASSAASDFGSTLGVNLQPLSSSGSNYTFYSPASFTIAGETIFSSVPASELGLAEVINESGLAGSLTPTAILTGVRSGSSFSHTVTFGTTETSVVGANGTFLLKDALDLAGDSFVSSPNATSTQVVVHSLDGLITTSDKATVTNHVANFSATYSASVPSGTSFRPNMTIVQNPPVLTATRTVDSGAAVSGGLVTLTLNFQNTADNGTIHNVTVNDNWWASYPSLFSLSAGNSSFTVPSVGAGQNVSRAYSLKVTSSASENLIVPASAVSYSYTVGNLTVSASTKTNEVEVRTNNPGPALEVQAGSDITSGSALGKPGNYVVTVMNTGNDPALNLNVLNYTNPTLTPGGVWKFNMSLPLTSIANRNLTQTFNLGWTAPDGSTGSLVSNPATVILSHSSLLLPIMEFKLSATITSQALALGSINATYSLSNKGTVKSDNVTVTQPLPAGVTCKSVLTGNGTCGSSGFSLTASSVAALGNDSGTVVLTFSNQNYLTEAASVTTNQGVLTLQTLGSVLPIPAGVSVTKTFAPTAVFEGENDNVTVRATNQGSLPVYNVTINTSPDSFDTAVSGALNANYGTLNSSASQSLNYTVKMLTPGNHTSASTSISFVFGGFPTQYLVSSGSVLVYKPIQAATSMASIPEEGHDFSLAISVQNLSPANVTNVSLSIPLPQGLVIVSYPAGFQVAGRTVTLTIASLTAGANSSSSIILRGDFDGSFNLGTGTLSFVYHGATQKGLVSTPAVVVGVDALLRYELPIGAAVILTLLVAVYIHRKMAVPPAK